MQRVTPTRHQKGGPPLLPTNQKVGSSSPPGRTISPNVYAGFCDATGKGCLSADVRITLWITCGVRSHQCDTEKVAIGATQSDERASR